MITTSGGGALITPDEDSWREKIGYNYRMSNICAGIGRGQTCVEADALSAGICSGACICEWRVGGHLQGGHVSASRPIRD